MRGDNPREKLGHFIVKVMKKSQDHFNVFTPRIGKQIVKHHSDVKSL